MRRISMMCMGAALALSFIATGPQFGFPTVAAQSRQAQNNQVPQEVYRLYSLFANITEIIRQGHVDKPDNQKLFESAFRGMLAGLDPHSSYMDAKEFQAMQQQTSGEFGGLGMEVQMEDGVVKVVSPIDETPAARAGILASDAITHVDDVDIKSEGLTLGQAIEKLRGPIGSSVTIRVTRKGRAEPINFTLIRDRIRVQSVKSNLFQDVGYVRITQFTEQTMTGLRKAIADIQSADQQGQLKGYVIDLRNDPGGLLDQSVQVSDAFLKSGEIVSTRGRNTEETQRFNAKSKTIDLIDGKPLIVLVNGGSASASEIVASALQDHHRATILGTRSFGKASVQTIIPLSNGRDGALRLTTARYFRPNGKTLQAIGVSPDIEVLQDEPEEIRGKSDTKGEASLKGHLKVDGQEEGAGSQSYIPTVVADDKALNEALALIRGEKVHPAFPPK